MDALKNKNIKLCVCALIVVLWTIIISHANFAKGFDFSDQTLTYHFSLRILNGDIPFIDFHTVVMPLAYYIEAAFHYIFGKNFIINAYLGLVLKFFQAWFIFRILYLFYKNIVVSMVFMMFLTSLFLAYALTYFSFTPLAATLSFMAIYYALLSLDDYKYLAIFGIFTGLNLLNKQNFGIVLIIAYVLYLLLMVFRKQIRVNRFCINLGLFFLAIMVAITPFMLYFNGLGALPEIGHILLTGAERKGLSDLNVLEFVNTLVPIQSPRFIVPSLIVSGVVFYLFKTSKRMMFILAAVGVLLLSVAAMFTEIRCFEFLIGILFYDGVKIVLIAMSLWLLLTKKNVDKKIYIVTIFLSAIVFTSELGWIGRGYALPMASGLFLLLLPYIFNEFDPNSSMQHNLIVMKNTSFVGVIIFIISFLFFPKERLYRDINANDTYSLEPYLLNYKMSALQKEAIIEFKEIYDNRCVEGNIFIFPWAPVLYDLIGAKNPTRFDMPQHDWLTEKEADEAILALKFNSPSLIIIDEASLSESGVDTDLPAKGMRRMEKFFRSEFLEDYSLIKAVQTYGKIRMIFLKNPSDSDVVTK